MTDKNLSRIRRQLAALGRYAPPARRVLDPLLRNGMRWVRVPTALLLFAGGIFSFLPVLGIWMLPLGLLLLAVDIPLLRPAVGGSAVRLRRRVRRLLRRRRAASPGR